MPCNFGPGGGGGTAATAFEVSGALVTWTTSGAGGAGCAVEISGAFAGGVLCPASDSPTKNAATTTSAITASGRSQPIAPRGGGSTTGGGGADGWVGCCDFLACFSASLMRLIC